MISLFSTTKKKAFTTRRNQPIPPPHKFSIEISRQSTKKWRTELRLPADVIVRPKKEPKKPSLNLNRYVLLERKKNPHTTDFLSPWIKCFPLFQFVNVACLLPPQNASAKTVKCKVCFQDFQSTVKKPELERHVENKHKGKAFTDCFPE